MDSKAVAIVIIGVSIAVLVLSSAIGDPPEETSYVVLVPPAKAQIPVNPVATAVNGGRSSRLLRGAGAGHGDGNMVCPSENGFNSVMAVALDLIHCTFAWRGEPSTVWRCDGEVVRDCVGDSLLNMTNPSDLHRPNHVFNFPA
ncbi:MAG TPA: hypothetical protein VJP60_04950 [Rhizomicrobium sp.]|nr:hypothetical protein [Rhizomicrobium sp.]